MEDEGDARGVKRDGERADLPGKRANVTVAQPDFVQFGDAAAAVWRWLAESSLRHGAPLWLVAEAYSEALPLESPVPRDDDGVRVVGLQPAHCAARGGRLDALKWLDETQRGGCAMVEDERGRQPIHYAAAAGRADVVRYLPRVCAVAQDLDRCQAVHYAAHRGHLDLVKWLVAGVGVPAGVRARLGVQPIHLAAAGNHLALVQWLVKEQGVSHVTRDERGRTPHALALAHGAAEAAAWLAREDAPLSDAEWRHNTVAAAASAVGMLSLPDDCLFEIAKQMLQNHDDMFDVLSLGATCTRLYSALVERRDTVVPVWHAAVIRETLRTMEHKPGERHPLDLPTIFRKAIEHTRDVRPLSGAPTTLPIYVVAYFTVRSFAYKLATMSRVLGDGVSRDSLALARMVRDGGACAGWRFFAATLLFRASAHGFEASAFHAACDTRGPLLILARSNRGCVFGAFTSRRLRRASADQSYSADPAARLFVLRNDELVARRVRRLPLVYSANGDRQDCAVQSHPALGPSFGFGSDLCIADRCNQADASFSNLGTTFNGDEARSDTLGGSVLFGVDEYEVFELSQW